MNNNLKKKKYKFLQYLLHKSERESLMGDFDETYHEIQHSRGFVVAMLWYWLQIFKSLPSFIYDSMYRSRIMFGNYVKITLRNLRKYKMYSFVNISGLAVGMAACILILLYIRDELSYDRYHEKGDRIYRAVISTQRGNGVSSLSATAAPALAPALKRDFPEVEDAVKILTLRGGELLVNYGQKYFYEKKIFYADPEIFNVFSFAMVSGDPATALEQRYSIVLTETMASKYFGDEDPLNKTLKIGGAGREFKVTGIIKDIPRNSHLRFDFLLPSEARGVPNLDQLWAWWVWYTYVLIDENSSAEELLAKFPDIADENYVRAGSGELFSDRRELRLQLLTDIHLKSNIQGEIAPNGSLTYVLIFAAIAFLTLFIACVNFTNLSTAKSMNRAREVGMRKVVGAKRSQLMKQFIGESIILSIVSSLFALAIVGIVLPAFNSFSGKEITLSLTGNEFFYLGMAALTLFVGVLSGMYPALLLSALKPIAVLKEKLTGVSQGSVLRRVLVVSQFAISIFLVIGASVISQQLQYIKSKDLGFDKEYVLLVPIRTSTANVQYDLIRDRFQQLPGVLVVGASSGVPGSRQWTDTHWTNADQSDGIHLNYYSVDYDFVRSLGIEITDGRDFSRDFMGDTSGAIILTESGVQGFGLENPVGQEIISRRGPLRIVGVTNDFHFQSLHRKIEPFGFRLEPNNVRTMAIRVSSQNLSETIEAMRRDWDAMGQEVDFEYSFLEEDYANAYRAEVKLETIFEIFTLLAVFIACLGLFALATFSAESRVKEIGIRKTLGASLDSIVLLLSKEFVFLIAVANVVAWPVSYYLLNGWIEGFAYRTTIGVVPFIKAFAIAVAIAFLTVSFQSLKTAFRKPVEFLRYE